MIRRFSLYGFLKNQRYFEPFIILFFLQQGLSFTEIGFLIAFRELIINLMEIPSGAIADLFGRRRSMMLSFTSYIASFAIFGFSQVYWHFFIAMFFFAIGEAFRTGTHKAMIFTSHADYGALSPHVKKMAHQLSWNVNIIKVLEQAKERLERSETLARVFRILIETYNSGGSIDDTLDSLSSTMMTIQDTEKERKSTLNQYVIAMYVISIVFIGIIIGINWLMVPLFQSMATPVGGVSPVGGIITNPCNTCVDATNPACAPCGIYSGICSLFGTDTTSISCYYLALFFSISIIQALMGGLVAGQIGEGSVKAGFKHSLILFSVTVATFLILVKLKVIGV